VITVKNCGSRSALDCCDEALYWAASNGGYDSTVQDVMLGAVERRFGNSLPTSPVEWLTTRSAYRSYQTRQFARMVDCLNIRRSSLESNGMAESQKTMKIHRSCRARRVNSGKGVGSG
jgi:putative transposase